MPQAHYDRIRAANSVLIIGGGPVGVETAGEILAEFPGMLRGTLLFRQQHFVCVRD